MVTEPERQIPADIKNLQFACCFCSLPIEQDEKYAIIIAIMEVDGEDLSQEWWAHPKCYGGVLHENSRIFRPEFEDQMKIDL